MQRIGTGLVILIASVSAAQAAELCFLNAANQRLFIGIEAEGGRNAGWRAHGGAVCVPGPGPATVSAFLSDRDLEGCSRRLKGRNSIALLDFQGVDLCVWSED